MSNKLSRGNLIVGHVGSCSVVFLFVILWTIKLRQSKLEAVEPTSKPETKNNQNYLQTPELYFYTHLIILIVS